MPSLPSPSAAILIVEDDLDIAEMLESCFRTWGYTVFVAHFGEDAVTACASQRPDLVLLDIRLPDVDGFEVARRLKASARTASIPIIFLTERRERSDRMRGLELKADDYITKPFDVHELRLRVRNALGRSRRATLTNPVTGLPEGVWVAERLVDAGSGCHLALISILHLEQFRERYGFLASDDLLRAVGMMLSDALDDLGEEAFLGHLTPAEFVIITSSEHTAGVIDQLRGRLEQSFAYFYRHQDREASMFRGNALAASVRYVAPGEALPDEIRLFQQYRT